MKISSYNITDVGYHYIGLRVLAALPNTARREDQTTAISRGVLKYASDRALRLMLPEPKGTFEAVGEKVCNELVHFRFATSSHGRYDITDDGKYTLSLLNEHKFIQLRRLMASVHLRTYDNLRYMVQRHLEIGFIWRPIVEVGRLNSENYFERLLEPTFHDMASGQALIVEAECREKSPGKIEDALQERVLRHSLPDMVFGESLFRSLCDRLISLRLLNVMRANVQECDFAKSYSPCVAENPSQKWYFPLDVILDSGETYKLYFCEPDMSDADTQRQFLDALEDAFSALVPQASYYDLPDVRDTVCLKLRVPEATFDEGVNYLLDIKNAPLNVGLRYEGISARRRPLIRSRETTQIYNLIRRA